MRKCTCTSFALGLAICFLAAQPSAAVPAGSLFVPATPCRVVDTRFALGSFGSPSLSAGGTRDFQLPLGTCGIPENATAYSLNITVVPAGPLGYLTVWPTGQAKPLVSTLNSDGRIKAVAAIVAAGTAGGISFYSSNQTDLVLDVTGYFVPSSAAGTKLAFYPVAPCRVVDTRGAAGALGGPALAGEKTRAFPILSSSCSIPETAQAYSLNITVIPAFTLSYITVWATGQAQPVASTLNARTGAITANAALVPAGSGGDITLFATDTTDLIIDINGYFALPGSGLSLYTVTPCRVLDSRLPQPSSPETGSQVVSVSGSSCGVPSAGAYILNATVVPPAGLGYITLWADGQSQPVASTLNALDAAVTSNMAIVPSTDGSIEAFESSPTYLILDISGYFAPDIR